MSLDRNGIATLMLTTVPRCLAGFRTTTAESPEPWKGNHVAVWRLACPCGGERGALLGYPLSRYNPKYSGTAFVGPLALDCEKCRQVTELFDTHQHGYHVEACACPTHVAGTGPRDRFRCPDCQGGQFAIVTSFFFWEASIDLVEDEPEEFEPRAQDLFCEFVAHGQCEKCDRWVRFTDFGKL
jgi:hypothetical protein